MVMAGLVPATPIIWHGRAPTIGVAGTSPAMTPMREVRIALSPALLHLDLVQSCDGLAELVVEQPHRVEDFAERRRGLRAVDVAEGEDAVVAQISHDGWIGNPVIDEIA